MNKLMQAIEGVGGFDLDSFFGQGTTCMVLAWYFRSMSYNILTEVIYETFQIFISIRPFLCCAWSGAHGSPFLHSEPAIYLILPSIISGE